ncbi:MAG: rhomboid family intramembrane serine protease [Planctomycetaceae bacterium]|jgi:membrane associated rhomboid family serine protease|nr:rhomboid family intramembrane serine protease [Planctomycetaceae bacterium]
MGFSDRDYNRVDIDQTNKGSRRAKNSGTPMSVTMRIVIVNLFLWISNGLFFPHDNWLTSQLMMPSDVLFKPLYWYTFLTSGFVHSPASVSHIAVNMIGLLMFGYGLAFSQFGLARSDNVEWRLGRNEYLCFYLCAIIFSSLSHAVFSGAGGLGASGGVVAVIVLFGILYPNKTILLFFIFPVPAWFLVVIVVYSDLSGALGGRMDGIGYTAHLGGAAFAIGYYYLMFKKRRTLSGFLSFWTKIKNTFTFKPNLKIRSYDDDDDNDTDNDTDKNDNNKNYTKNINDAKFEKQLDEILDRYGKVGEAGLTKEEREFLREASRIYRNRTKK